jgi:phosphate starvation-inducible PhoH-like protein
MKKNKPVRDTSPVVPQKNKLKGELTISQRPLTEKQKQFLSDALNKETKLMFVSGPAGTAKTFTAVMAALRLLNDKKVSDIIYLRSAVESAEAKIGYLPGEAEDKMSPYLQPLLEKLSELLPSSQVDQLKKDGRVSNIALGFLRGLNWNAKAIIADECQNMTFKELTTLITRTGEFSKVFIIGDPGQIDIKNSGFTAMVNTFNDADSVAHGIRVFEFNEDDIVRSELVKYIAKKIKNRS